jgi:hypothetical protein
VLLDGYSGSRIPVLPPLRGKTSLMITAWQAADSSHMLLQAVSSISPAMPKGQDQRIGPRCSEVDEAVRKSNLAPGRWVPPANNEDSCWPFRIMNRSGVPAPEKRRI